MKRKLFCTIPQKLIQQPLLFTLVNRFKVVPNIRGASVTETIAILSLELEGDDANVEEAVAYLKEEGVQVETLEDGQERTV
ncbi:MAG: ferredoxin [Planctomycetes bacterium]|nr:ferredoxin [Planctomycetota bacterium]MCP4772484.1 ferredoxin [Planctomycetota bacterium]MCP4860123.1 ferredoxin [Planctomycetota bacterium]